jgi:hypothetical protein
MRVHRPLPIERMLVAFGVLAISLYSAVTAYAATISGGGNDHQTADWLISYPDTFVRRGLFGELLFTIAPPGQSTLWVLFAIQVALYVPLVAYFVDYLFRANFSWSAIALACSPAALPFIGWDTLGGFRKETLGFLALVLLALARRRVSTWLRALLLTSSLAIWTIGVFSWEALAFLLPGIAFLLLSDRELPLRRTLTAAYALIGLAAFGSSVLYHGDADTPSLLCDAVVSQGLGANLCTGAIAWIGRDLDASFQMIDKYLAVHSGYLAMLALGVLPIALSGWLRRYWAWGLAALVGIAPLFVLGIDYGRWVHILVIELAICMIASNLALIESKLWNPLSALLFVSLWGIPHAAPTLPDVAGWPFKGLLATLINWMQSALLRIL